MKITGQQNFNFSGLPTGSNPPFTQAYLYSGAISKPLLGSPFTGYYDFIGNRKIRKKLGPDSNYTLVATGIRLSGVYETPHGISYTSSNYQNKAGKNGHYNFYMAFYGPGYYQPRVGELLTFGEVSPGLFRSSKIQINDLNSSEALKVFGLRLVPNISSSKLPYSACKNLGGLASVHEGTHDCPVLIKKPYKFEALAADFSAGTYLGGIGGNPYGHNPLPSPYDRSIFIADSIYRSKFDPVHEKCLYEEKNQKPIPTYDIRAMTNSLGGTITPNKQLFIGDRNSDGDYSICSRGADGEDSSLAAYVDGTNISPPHSTSLGNDGLDMPIDPIDLSYNSKNAYWHYAFKYNHYSLPFENTSEASTMVEAHVNTAENENHWWEYRECPENVDFLNHAFGNNINACPMNYLDVPYYASIGKFGYFGTRFQNTWRYIENEDPSGLKHVDYPHNPQDPDKFLDKTAEYSPRGASYSAIPTTKDYDDLIKLSAIEKNNYSFSISDEMIFLRLNHDVITKSPEYLEIVSKDLDFSGIFKNFLFNFFEVNNSAPYFNHVPRGLSYAEKDSPLSMFSSSLSLGPKFETLVKKYGYVKVTRVVNALTDMRSNGDGGAIDVEWYNNLVNNKLARISNRYYVNIGLGKPVDLFPEGIITFSAEKTSEFAENNFLKYGSVSSAAQLRNPQTNLYQEIPNTELRYFHTALSTQSEVDRFEQNKFIPIRNIFFAGSPVQPSSNLTAQTRSFYLGYLNPKGCESDLPSTNNSYNILKIINTPTNGIWTNYAPESSPPPFKNDSSPPRFVVEEARTLDKNFSCFSPLFLQQPINTLTKSFLPATFRVFAVDYHSIPEDKILENSRQNGIGRPEIAYWLKKIKAIDSKGKNLYPLTYKWYRIAEQNIPIYLKTKNEALLEPSSPTGTWYCFEGDNSPDCTVVIPHWCRNLAGLQASFPCSIDSLGQFAGPNVQQANAFRYFCRVIGRFGWRDSELAKITCDPTIEMEFAFLNSAMTGGSSFSTPLGNVSFSDSGWEADDCAVFEDVQQRIWNSFNDCESWRHIGPEGIGGVTRVWTPGTISDPRGRIVTKSHWTPFGRLGVVKTSNEALCAEFYAKRALPYCDIGKIQTYPGVPITSPQIIHRTAVDTATFTANSSVGLIAEKIKNIAELYPPPLGYGSTVNFPGHPPPINQPAHFQFENNLGLIKKFSRHDTGLVNYFLGVETTKKIGGQGDLSDLINTVKNKIFNVAGGEKVISGPECGYVKPSFGRFMHFYVETFQTFYSLCLTGLKPKKVKNLSHISGGLRAKHAGLQFNWLGRPKNARLKRESMPGPYGFQWKVERHNRDRRGNGMSLGFWSYFWEERIENMYDAAAVVGALKRLRPSPGKSAYANQIRSSRNSAALSLNNQASTLQAISMFRNVRFGPDLGPKLGCGNIRIKNEDPIFKPNRDVVSYAESTSSSAIELKDFGCEGVNQADCFLPCVSLKWPDGFSPKGKKMVNATITSCYDCDEATPLLAASTIGGAPKKIWRKKISACSDGNRDACNYITPTIHLGIDSWLMGSASSGTTSIAGLLGS